MARKLYQENNGKCELDFQKIFAISKSTLNYWTQDIRSKIQEDQAEQIFQLYLQCKTYNEIKEKLNVSDGTISRSLERLQNTKIGEMESPQSLHLIDNWSFY